VLKVEFMKKSLFAIFILAPLLFLAGCGSRTPQANLPPTAQPPEALYTAAVQTVYYQITKTALSFTPPPSITDTPQIETSTPLPPAPTPLSQASPTPEATQTSTPTQTPKSTPSSTSQSATTPTLIFEDDFESSQNWYANLGQDYGFEFQNGAYRIYNKLLGAAIWSVREDQYTDVRLEVDVTRTAGPEDGYFGLTCRHQDADNYYALVIGSDGFYGIARMKTGDYAFLAQGVDQSEVIKPGNTVNRVRADCIGATLTLYANGKKLIEAQDDSFTSGKVGLITGNKLIEKGVEVLFDNFEIWMP
jgi:predicted small lipoprotein YifL